MKKFAFSLAVAAAMSSLCASVQAAEPIDPIEPVEVKNPALVELGKMLFFEPRLSRSGFISCNSCHNFGQVAQFWDGRAKTLAEQAAGPIANPLEMASTHEMAVKVIASIIGLHDLPQRRSARRSVLPEDGRRASL